MKTVTTYLLMWNTWDSSLNNYVSTAVKVQIVYMKEKSPLCIPYIMYNITYWTFHKEMQEDNGEKIIFSAFYTISSPFLLSGKPINYSIPREFCQNPCLGFVKKSEILTRKISWKPAKKPVKKYFFFTKSGRVLGSWELTDSFFFLFILLLADIVST